MDLSYFERKFENFVYVHLNVSKTKPVAPSGHPLLLLLFFQNKSCMHNEVRTCKFIAIVLDNIAVWESDISDTLIIIVIIIIIIVDIYPGSSTHPKVFFRKVPHPFESEFGNVDF